MSFAFAMGTGTKNTKNQWLEVFYPQPVLAPESTMTTAALSVLNAGSGNQTIEVNAEQLKQLSTALKTAGANEQANLAEKLSASARPAVVVILEQDVAPTSTAEVYLKLHLLSHRLVKPHGLNLTGMFGLLPNVAWTNEGAIDIEELPERQLQARLAGRVIDVKSIDKFPQMSDYVVPTGVRIADAARVRLGAHIGEGTTIMHEGFVNFNAGTLGVSMVEGRISAGVVVGNGSDLGGGCSTMGTLSGGGNIVISVGQNCLLGANAGIGIPLGDRCTVESGLYITAGTKVLILDDQNAPVETCKARDLAGKSDLLFRRNSTTGQVECKTNKSAIELNAELHANN